MGLKMSKDKPYVIDAVEMKYYLDAYREMTGRDATAVIVPKRTQKAMELGGLLDGEVDGTKGCRRLQFPHRNVWVYERRKLPNGTKKVVKRSTGSSKEQPLPIHLGLRDEKGRVSKRDLWTYEASMYNPELIDAIREQKIKSPDAYKVAV
jgi:hypothetical protein